VRNDVDARSFETVDFLVPIMHFSLGPLEGLVFAGASLVRPFA